MQNRHHFIMCAHGGAVKRLYLGERERACVCVCLRACACVRACGVCECARVCVRFCICVAAFVLMCGACLCVYVCAFPCMFMRMCLLMRSRLPHSHLSNFEYLLCDRPAIIVVRC